MKFRGNPPWKNLSRQRAASDHQAGIPGFCVRFHVDGAKMAAALPAHRNTSTVSQKLLKVPFNAIEAHRRPNAVLGVVHEHSGIVTGRWQGLLQEVKKRVNLLTIHFTLLTQCKVELEPNTGSVTLEGIQNFFFLGIAPAVRIDCMSN